MLPTAFTYQHFTHPKTSSSSSASFYLLSSTQAAIISHSLNSCSLSCPHVSSTDVVLLCWFTNMSRHSPGMKLLRGRLSNLYFGHLHCVSHSRFYAQVLVGRRKSIQIAHKWIQKTFIPSLKLLGSLCFRKPKGD